MQNKTNTILLILIVVLLAVGAWFLANKEVSPKVPGPSTPPPTVLEPKIIGPNASDLISFSVAPGGTVSGKMTVVGQVEGGYFFEANILVNILGVNKALLRAGHGTASGEWMTAGPVAFTADLDFAGLPAGPGYIEIKNDNASGLPEHDKQILIPVVIQ